MLDHHACNAEEASLLYQGRHVPLSTRVEDREKQTRELREKVMCVTVDVFCIVRGWLGISCAVLNGSDRV